jgi:hypothetical protein
MRAALIVSMLLAGPAWAETVVHPPIGVPDPYIGMSKPGSTISCCSGVDCGQATMCIIGGDIGWREQGQCNPLPADRFVHQPPDAVDRSVLHVCRTPRWVGNAYAPEVHCWTGGPST